MNKKTESNFTKYFQSFICGAFRRTEQSLTPNITTEHIRTLPSGLLSNIPILIPEEIEMIIASLEFITDNHRTVIVQKLRQSNEIYSMIRENKIEATHSLQLRQTLEMAIAERRFVTFTYVRKKPAKYVVEPHQIVECYGHWYLLGLDNGVIKKFHLDFVEELDLSFEYSNEPFTDIKQKVEEACTIWFAPQKPELAKLEINEKVAKYYHRKQIFPAQVILAIKDDGNIVITAEFANKEDFFEQAGRWMPFISVIEPQAYRDYICEKALHTLEVNEAL
ncbi:MAG: WYL domain-containing protein [Actinomycetes bacterium]